MIHFIRDRVNLLPCRGSEVEIQRKCEHRDQQPDHQKPRTSTCTLAKQETNFWKDNGGLDEAARIRTAG